MQLTVECLPVPFGPIIENNSRSRIEKLTSVSALTPPNGNVTRAASRMGAAIEPCGFEPCGFEPWDVISVTYPIRRANSRRGPPLGCPAMRDEPGHDVGGSLDMNGTYLAPAAAMREASAIRPKEAAMADDLDQFSPDLRAV